MESLALIGYIYLTKGRKAIVDFRDVQWLSQWKWQCSLKGYATRAGGAYMHVEIMRRHGIEPNGHDVDHRDGNPLNCCFSNLRIATRSQNAANAPKPKNNTSGFKGVTWNAKTGKWMARIGYNWGRKFLGYYDSPVDAAKAYNKASIELFGDFSKLNVFEDGVEVGTLEGNYATRVKQNKKISSAQRHSIYKGVALAPLHKTQRWKAQIFVHGKVQYIGTFSTQEDAAYIFNLTSLFLYGRDGVINQLPEDYEPPQSLTQLHCFLPWA